MMNDWNEALFLYYKEAGGNFTGDIESAYQECRLSFEYGDRNITLEPVIKGVGNGTLAMHARAILSGQMDKPFTMVIQPYGIVKKAVELVMREDISIGNPALDKKYLIRGSEPEFIKMVLNGSRLAELLVNRKDVEISVKPVKEGETLHMFSVVTKGSVNDTIIGAQWEGGTKDFAELVELCYETWRAVTDYRIPTPGWYVRPSL